ncbi:MAG: cell division protein ZapA [Buchnera aphidicola (Schlechtendalia peitan)]
MNKMPVQCVNIKLFGQLLKVNCPDELSNELKHAANYLNKRLQDLKIKTRASNTNQLVLVTALNISYELEQERIKIKEVVIRMQRMISNLQKFILIK